MGSAPKSPLDGGAPAETGAAEARAPRPLLPASAARRRALTRTAEAIDRLLEELPDFPVVPEADRRAIRERLAAFDFREARGHEEVLDEIVELLRRWSLHTAHPRYFGLFNPSASLAGVLADALVAAFNSQIGAWKHNPIGVEIELHVLRWLGARFGFPPEAAHGFFTSGGSEANAAAVLVALARAFPEFPRTGARGLTGDPVLYVSEEAHHSFHKIAVQCGLGREAVRTVPVDAALRLDPDSLARAIAADRAAGRLPFLAVATAGTTTSGVVDPLAEVAEVSAAEGLHYHVDAAWGGAAALSRRLAPLLAGIERADSVTFDPHKWLSVPMGCGLFLCRDRAWLDPAFGVDVAYVPRGAPDEVDFYKTSFQWSRRFIGLKLFFTLAVAGERGYERTIETQAEMGDLLRAKLRARGFAMASETPLPLVCFREAGGDAGAVESEAERYEAIVARVLARRRAWISTSRVRGRPVLRACITSFRTTEADLDVLVDEIEAARRSL